MIVREAMDWKTARNKCRSFGFGSQLAKIRCSLDNRFVKGKTIISDWKFCIPKF